MAIDEEGWLHTGDLGQIDEEGHLHITGRRKNVIVTATGKNVIPSKVESEIQSIPLVSHCLVCGDGKSFLAALITTSASKMAEWARQRSILYENVERLRTDMRLYRDVEAHIEKVNQRLAPHERVRRFAILDAEFSSESGELTHDFKLRRQVVLKRNREVLEMLYEERY